jgi:hypothetical protein
MKEKFAQIGKTGTISIGRMKVDVKIKDYKYTYGRDRWLISPLSGTGEMWVENLTLK